MKLLIIRGLLKNVSLFLLLLGGVLTWYSKKPPRNNTEHPSRVLAISKYILGTTSVVVEFCTGKTSEHLGYIKTFDSFTCVLATGVCIVS